MDNAKIRNNYLNSFLFLNAYKIYPNDIQENGIVHSEFHFQHYFTK
jgi:hypothetical protein